MGMFDLFKKTKVELKKRTPLTPDEARYAARVFQFVKDFECGCGAHLKIRTKEDRSSGPSNFQPDAQGHSKVPSGLLTWDGLAEERGWKVRPTMCPACQRGLTVDQYKRLRRGE